MVIVRRHSHVLPWGSIRNLKPVTQLYVSLPPSTKDSLKKIDRPLFKDFWQRFLDSLKALATKKQRTVYRLTLVKAWNVDELQAYAELVSLGNPDFIEVKVSHGQLHVTPRAFFDDSRGADLEL
ncbi:S-adenosyl-L-methionine-dependent tRNA 4-demethylwyosine synthase TYW1-like [Ochotona curzoniae]|uniref:S-adenosyl-L-methionine-dependent tRNA 4-demethylwyosine synthase TYW1-like n=1 Tax=Ochotona curzoniae TaxID=130825 RepID=UPI001B352C03|nr:S-adenosyl-L-methionine-dependent tRNA 4-demethylwyosine synthase TYW1-like [Ochotona curzoniae]